MKITKSLNVEHTFGIPTTKSLTEGFSSITTFSTLPCTVVESRGSLPDNMSVWKRFKKIVSSKMLGTN